MFYHHDLDRFLLGPWQIGSIENFGIRWYSLSYIVGFLLVYAALRRAVARRLIPNADGERLEEACLILICAVIAGGRIGYFLLNEPHVLMTWEGWKQVPRVWEGGMAFYGAAAAVFGVEWWFCRIHRVGFWHGADKMLIALSIGIGLGRIANFVNGELWGNPTNGSWGVYFPDSELIGGVLVPRHPVQLYGALSHFLLAWWLHRRLHAAPRGDFDRAPGLLLWHFFGGYGLLRFVTDFWRHENENLFIGPIHGGQILSLAMFALAFVGAWARVRWLRRNGGELDWYPAEGALAPLPDACHTFIEEVRRQRAAAEQQAAARREAKRAAKTADQPPK